MISWNKGLDLIHEIFFELFQKIYIHINASYKNIIDFFSIKIINYIKVQNQKSCRKWSYIYPANNRKNLKSRLILALYSRIF